MTEIREQTEKTSWEVIIFDTVFKYLFFINGIFQIIDFTNELSWNSTFLESTLILLFTIGFWAILFDIEIVYSVKKFKDSLKNRIDNNTPRTLYLLFLPGIITFIISSLPSTCSNLKLIFGYKGLSLALLALIIFSIGYTGHLKRNGKCILTMIDNLPQVLFRVVYIFAILIIIFFSNLKYFSNILGVGEFISWVLYAFLFFVFFMLVINVVDYVSRIKK